MLKTYMQLPDGTVLSSGSLGEDVIISLSFTQCVNSSQELHTGSVCANMVEIKLLGHPPIAAGDRLKIWREDEGGNICPLGIFFPEEPTREGANYLKLTAYDSVVRLDKDVTPLLKQLQTTTLQVLAEEVCNFCGVVLAEQELPLGGLPISALSGEGITGRQVLGWISQLTGHFCRANAEGSIEFAWYRERNDVSIGITSGGGGGGYNDGVLSGLTGSVEENTLTLSCQAEMGEEGTLQIILGGKTVGYYSGSLSYAEYTVESIEKVQLKKTAEDVGTVYPDGLEGERNTYILEGNPLLGAVPEENLPEIAAHLLTRLQGITYTPCKVSIPAGSGISAGDVVQLTDKNGKTISIYVMSRTQSGQRDTLECTGSRQRAATTAVNNKSYADMAGKVMNLRTDLQGLKAEHHNSAGKLSRLELDMEGIRSQVSGQTTLGEQISKVEQTAESLQISVEKLYSDGTNKLKTAKGYTFDDTGLHIREKDGEVENCLDESGMKVLRKGGTDGETVMLRADAQGVLATDVTVRNYLIVGTHARLEDYAEGRTACFYLGGA